MKKEEDRRVTAGVHDRLAEEFSRVLRKSLFPKELRLVRERNRAEKHCGVCHSHDFVDANMKMSEAFVNVIGREVDIQSDYDILLWNRAWNKAKADEFRPKGRRKA